MHFNKYLKTLIVVFIFVCIPLMLNGLFLYSAGEFDSVESIVDFQLENDFKLAGFATHDLSYEYKLRLYEKTLPNIVAIGSSRVLPFRKDVFNQTFLNMGRAMNNIDQGYFLTKDMLSIHTPKIAIIGLDFWWFVTNAQPNINYYKPPLDKSNLSIRLLIDPFIWIFQKKIDAQYYFQTLKSIFLRKKDHYIGINAQVKKDGFIKDGSYYYLSLVTKNSTTLDTQFKNTISDIIQGRGLFPHHQKINEIFVQRFFEIVKMLEDNNVTVYVFIPPVSNTVYQLMSAKKEYEYVNQWINMFENFGSVKVHSFHNPEVVNGSDCEFIDGFHGGEILYLKILDDIAKQSDNKNLLHSLNNDYIHINKNKYKNHVMVPVEKIKNFNEVDFLELNCNKQILLAQK